MYRRWAVLLIVAGLLASPAWTDEPAQPVVKLTRGITFEAGDQIVRSLAWSPDGTRLAAGCSDRSLRLWAGGAKKPYAMVTLDRYG